MISSYLTDVIILLVAAVVAVPLFKAIKFGAVPGFLIAGVVIGPSGLALINKVSEISHLAEIGVVMLLFVIGIELKPSRLWRMRRLVFGLGSLQVLLTGFIIGIIIYLIFDVPLRASLLIGPALSLSSTAFVLQLLSEQKALHSDYGRSTFAILLLQDLAVVPLLALVPILAMPELSIGEDIGFALLESLLIVIAIILLGRYLLNPLLHRIALADNAEIFTASSLLIVLGAASIIEHVGLSMAMGAFLAGLLISDSSYKHQVIAEIQPFRGLFLGLFFMSMGMSLNLTLFLEAPLLSMGLVIFLISLKVVILIPLCYMFGVNKQQSIAVGLILAQSGEFALVLFSLAFQAQLLSNTLYQQLLLVILLSIIVTPLLAFFAQRFLNSEDRTLSETDDEQQPQETAPIVLAGYGRVGKLIGEMLQAAEVPYIAIDSKASLVKKYQKHQHTVFYGDVRKPRVLHSVGAGDAQNIIVTINDPDACEKLVASLHKSYPLMKIYARANSLEQCHELKRLGASAAISGHVEASIALTRMVLINTTVSESNRESLIEDFRTNYLEKIDAITEESPIK